MKNREGKSRVQREGRGEEEKGRRDKKNVGKRTKPGCDSRPVVSGSPSHHLRATNNSCYKHTVGAQELKYPGGTRPLLEEGGRGGAAGGRRAWRRLSILTGCSGRPGPVQSLADSSAAGPGPVIGTCSAAGRSWQLSAGRTVFICTLEEAAVWLLIQKNPLRSMTSLGMEYLSLQMIAPLPALDKVLANVCNCWKCDDGYLHI